MIERLEELQDREQEVVPVLLLRGTPTPVATVVVVGDEDKLQKSNRPPIDEGEDTDALFAELRACFGARTRALESSAEDLRLVLDECIAAVRHRPFIVALWGRRVKNQ